MEIYLIYKQILDSQGNVVKVELVECDMNETNAEKFRKLYTLQTAKDFKDKVLYQYMPVMVS
jgi:hypothetical protein